MKKIMPLYLILTFILQGFASTSRFIPNSVHSITPHYFENQICIDGELEKAWEHAATFTNFVEYQPTENRQPGTKTQGFAAFDQDYFYIAFQCFDDDISQLRASFTDRDQMFEDDWICVSLDPFAKNQQAVQFYVNPRGVQGDKLWQLNADFDDNSYDLVWDSEARIYDDHWCVEMRIPFESLRFPENAQQRWTVHFLRYYPRELPYRFSWMPISRNNNSFMGQAGFLEFELAERSGKNRNLELLPYAISSQNSVRSAPTNNNEIGGWDTSKPDTRAGIGLKYGLSSNLILDLTFNPDFSQIESDAGQISINNPFALFFEEKRPFFLEGSGVYSLDQTSPGIAVDQFVNLFYSRSINNPLVAGKFTGQAGKYSFGWTSALDQNTPFIIPFQGRSAVLATELESVSNIARLKYDLSQESSIGVFTSHRQLKDASNTVAAVDASIRLTDKLKATAIVSVSNTHEMDNDSYSSRIGDETFEQGGKTYTGALDGEQFNGYLLRGKLQRTARHWSYALCLQDFSPGFRADNGFIWTTGYRNAEGTTAYAFRWNEHPLLSAIVPRLSGWQKRNYNGVVIDTGIRPTLQIALQKQINLFFGGFIYNRENLYGKQFDDARNVWFFVSSNTFKSVYASAYLHIGEEINRMGLEGNSYNPFEIVPSRTLDLQLTLRPTEKITNDIQMRMYNLWRPNSDALIKKQMIVRNSLSYQFNKKISFRLIGEYSIINAANSETGLLQQRQYLSLEPLFSYKLNAFSVFYMGGSIGARDDRYPTWDNMHFHNQTAYIKLQYLLGI